MNAESKRRRQKAVIGIVLAVVIVALFTVTIGIGMNNGDTGDGVVGMGGPGDTLTAYGVGHADAERIATTSSDDVILHGLTVQEGKIDLTTKKQQLIYAGTSGFFMTIEATAGSFSVEYYAGELRSEKQKVQAELETGQTITLSYNSAGWHTDDIDYLEHRYVKIVKIGAGACTGKYQIF